MSDILITILLGRRLRHTTKHGDTIEGKVHSITPINPQGTFVIRFDENDWNSSEEISDPVIFIGMNEVFEILD